jgi:hypothetical protein
LSEEVDEKRLNELKREMLAKHGIPAKIADSLQLANVTHNENGSVTLSFVADDLTKTLEK